MKKVKNADYNYFKKKERIPKERVVKYGNFTFICDDENQAELFRKWLKAGGNFEIK